MDRLEKILPGEIHAREAGNHLWGRWHLNCCLVTGTVLLFITKVELFQILKDDAVKVLHSICQQIWKTQQWSPKKGNAKECSNYPTTALISHASKVMFKILQARLQQYVN